MGRVKGREKCTFGHHSGFGALELRDIRTGMGRCDARDFWVGWLVAHRFDRSLGGKISLGPGANQGGIHVMRKEQAPFKAEIYLYPSFVSTRW